MTRVLSAVLLCACAAIAAHADEPPKLEKTENKNVAKIVRGIRDACDDNAALGKRAVFGDELTEKLIKQAATEALKLPKAEQVDGFLTSIGIGLDRFNDAAQNVNTAKHFKDIETFDDAKDRQKSLRLKKVSMLDEFYFTAYWSRSAGITGRMGRETAEELALGKQTIDVLKNDSFEWRNLNAAQSGIEFADRLKSGKLSLTDVAEKFTVAKVIVARSDLPPKLSYEDFTKKHGRPEVTAKDMAKLLEKELTDMKSKTTAHFDKEWPAKK